MGIKKIGSLTLATIGALVNILTLLSFIFTTNWKAPVISGLEPTDWAILTGILCLYSASLLASILLQRRSLDSGFSDFPPESWAHIPFSLPLAILWWRAFIIPLSQPDPILLMIEYFVISYLLIAMVAAILTYALVRLIG